MWSRLAQSLWSCWRAEGGPAPLTAIHGERWRQPALRLFRYLFALLARSLRRASMRAAVAAGVVAGISIFACYAGAFLVTERLIT